MSSTSQNRISISREVIAGAEADNDLFAYVNRVYAAIRKDPEMFGVENSYDLGIEEIHPKKVVVRNYKTGKFIMADVADRDGVAVLKNAKKVKRQWVTADGNERSHEILESGECTDIVGDLTSVLGGFSF